MVTEKKPRNLPLLEGNAVKLQTVSAQLITEPCRNPILKRFDLFVDEFDDFA